MDRHRAFLEKTAGEVADHEEFQALFAEGMEFTGMSLRDAAHAFKTAPGTISRWMNGHTAPSQVAREAILRDLRHRVQRIVRASRSKSGEHPAIQGEISPKSKTLCGLPKPE
jgi:transcriptional regulator with XRE-family HTH domain